MSELALLFKELVPVIATLIVIAIPAFMSIPMTILHVTFWRRDNRAVGNEPYTHIQIRDKVYKYGRIYGVSSVVLLQGLVEMLLKEPFSWWLRVCLVVIAFGATGFIARISFDILRARAAIQAGKGSERWSRVYKYITVDHVKAANGTDDTFHVRTDGAPVDFDPPGDDKDITPVNKNK